MNFWSDATEKLGERYRVWYGVTQGTWATVTITSLMSYERPIWQLLVLFAFGALTSVMWSWSWRKYRAAFRAETLEMVSSANEELRLLTEQLQEMRH